jgi:hypothetical protein
MVQGSCSLHDQQVIPLNLHINLILTWFRMGMSMNVLGMSEELKSYGIAVNALWPLTFIYTAALQAISKLKIL